MFDISEYVDEMPTCDHCGDPIDYCQGHPDMGACTQCLNGSDTDVHLTWNENVRNYLCDECQEERAQRVTYWVGTD